MHERIDGQFVVAMRGGVGVRSNNATEYCPLFAGGDSCRGAALRPDRRRTMERRVRMSKLSLAPAGFAF